MNNKFKPEEVPDWVKWIAVDKDGECWGFEMKPEHRNNCPNTWDNIVNENSSAIHLYTGKPPKDLKDELYTWE